MIGRRVVAGTGRLAWCRQRGKYDAKKADCAHPFHDRPPRFPRPLIRLGRLINAGSFKRKLAPSESQLSAGVSGSRVGSKPSKRKCRLLRKTKCESNVLRRLS